ncbi:MAG: tRNA (5-methylaminomethyl-2-thiouridylate)-methyltransferase [Candidatus Sedimenticola endophacoides]|uniref:tRNA (5-methylaminomethyl-2-thiouridylate)-methyltransferase n=1 Tax=Candidatus Sedimenticola endophacoides TaxID=2548426 RepID=A0A6N4E429_9GAMM|nr:MAG: tRNA (5-methylaminomethyl-2-thiouridylate)-methyltransferase [Candidatus Sedimenticola endophacoides]OQX33661.1 MAG: tRNA (5-methylaminomethyl-2-thiouridylate)-methyltransferase [Candidatus Sedimenticola endophacoides]OQX41069.1 MAG: tRNA (5-methylaminomethyl-2-thiouridylate)-methyltransferase [Candidatus Sedimenticola endophacoides]OQX43375.1 MAG: tRNA (5-methylaminomethyl-2-thiouridylate)-methyltransferase [Candidatus Sedimenticola endophacoides]OQX48373.1 MAG: tRNA (5-methylaminometh
MTEQRKAVALISGGLDSLLAARVIQDQGIHVEGINFFTGFCVEGHTHAIRKKDRAKPKRNNALWVAEQLGIRLHIVDIVEEYKEVVFNPPHGYGANLNPCLDCKIFMVRKAREWIAEHGFDFIITGEVIGQRPMSQRKDTMPVVARDSGADDLLLRPLCARNLPPTRPEREGWIERERLFDFSGRGRKPQMALAARLGLHDYAQPAGGCCFLTDAQYSAKLADLWRARGEKRYEMDDIMLLKVGRHLRPRPHFKVIISREEGEGNFLKGYKRSFISLTTTSCAGPLALIDGEVSEEDLMLVARLVARYSQGKQEETVELEVSDREGNRRALRVRPMAPSEVLEAWHL